MVRYAAIHVWGDKLYHSTLPTRATEKGTMPTDTDHWATLPPEQQRIRDKCYHPTGTFIPFPKEAVEQSIPGRFEQIAQQYPDRPAVKKGMEVPPTS